MIRVGIVGISGFSGKVLLDILLNHSEVRVTYVAANKTTGPVDKIWPEFKSRTKLVCEKYTFNSAVNSCDLIFLALPHTQSMEFAGALLAAGKKVIDLSADYRLKKSALYKKWYNVTHKDIKNLRKSVYGLPEIYKTKIQKAKFIANPGCYPTAALLGLAPLVSIKGDQVESLIVDAKSGVSGAGRKMAEGLLFSFANENFKAYRVLNHQHTPEIDQYLTGISGRDMRVTFVPHLLPVFAGILETIYVSLKSKVTATVLHSLYQKFYNLEPFVRVLPLGEQVELRNVVGTNYCDVSLVVSDDKRNVVITSAIDNLVKGASGQAVQNMNLMYGFKEVEGLL